jgi:hypothetical protein
MISLTAFERDLHRSLLNRARTASPSHADAALTTYVALGHELDPDGRVTFPMTRPPFRGLNEALGHVSMYEVEHGRPMLSALVVNQDTRKPGDGFGKLARHLGLVVDYDDEFWLAEVDQVIRLWAADDLVLILDAALDQVTRQLVDIKNALRRAKH